MTHDDALRIKELGIHTFVTNSMIFLEPWAHTIVAHDSAWWNEYKGRLNWFRGKRISGNAVAGCEVLPSHLWRNYANSGAMAIAYAVKSGFKNIILLGADCSIKDGFHCHGDHPPSLRNCNTVRGWRVFFENARRLADEHGARIINASRKTALTCFERMPLEDAIKEIRSSIPPKEVKKVWKRNWGNRKHQWNNRVTNGQIIVSGGGGIGDAIYVKCIADALVNQNPGQKIITYTKYPEIFSQSPGIEARSGRSGDGIKAHYTSRRRFPETSQWEDVKIESGVHDAEFYMTWTPTAKPIVNKNARPLVLVGALRPPMNAPNHRLPGVIDLLPNESSYKALVNAAKEAGYLTVEIGKGERLGDSGAEINLFNKTTIEQVFDLATEASLIIAPVSFMLVIAEAMKIPAIAMWARAGLKNRNRFISDITPDKIIYNKDSIKVCFDDDAPSRFHEIFMANV